MKHSLLVIAVIAFIFLGCTKQERARHFGGSFEVKLPAGRKLEIATWKDSQLWYLTRPMRADERPEVHEFHESSTYGFVEGKVTFYETR